MIQVKEEELSGKRSTHSKDEIFMQNSGFNKQMFRCEFNTSMDIKET